VRRAWPINIERTDATPADMANVFILGALSVFVTTSIVCSSRELRRRRGHAPQWRGIMMSICRLDAIICDVSRELRAEEQRITARSVEQRFRRNYAY
jgi:hypothetical protein